MTLLEKTTVPPRVETDIRNVDFSGLPRARRGELKSELRTLSGFDFTSYSEAQIDDLVIELRVAMRESDEAAFSLRAQALALLGEIAARELGLRPYLVQHLGALVLADGEIAEMATGEGKTLSLALAAAWAAMSGGYVHVMTANDYLATRDAETMGPLYARAGLSVGVTRDVATPDQRRAAYRSDVVYGTAVQFGFDYLFDNLAMSTLDKVQREHDWALVDEADSLLLDEARVPLIISGSPRPPIERVHWAQWAKQLLPSFYEIDQESRQVWLTETGIASAEKLAGVANLYDHPLQAALAQNALYAQMILEKDRDYLVGEYNGLAGVHIIDEGTGRVLEGRRWSDGVHEALEAKEGLEVRGQSTTLASVTVPSYLKLYEVVGGMTGTASAAIEEFAHLYDLQVLTIPPHRPRIRVDHEDRLYVTMADKLSAMTRDISAYIQEGRPILVGAPTVEDADMISAHLTSAGVAHQVLSARDAAREAEIIAQAGRPGTVTVATNMAGRGVDILLGGNAAGLVRARCAELGVNELDPDEIRSIEEQCARDRAQVIASGGLVVVATARHSSKRVDDQLRGRSGRQGEPGTTQFYLSCEDELLERFASGKLGDILTRITARQGEALTHRMVTSVVDDAQKRAEGIHVEQRNRLSKMDKVYGAQQAEIYRFRNEILGQTWRENIISWGKLADEYEVLVDCLWPFVGDPLRDVHTGEPISEPDDEKYRDEFWVPPTPDDLDAYLDEQIASFLERCSEVPEEALDASMAVLLCQTIDANWQNQLTTLDTLREGIYLRQRLGDPVTQFALDAHELFIRMTRRMLAIGVAKISSANIRVDSITQAPEPQPTSSTEVSTEVHQD